MDFCSSAYELGRLYYEMGYMAAAERIFGGLARTDAGTTPSRIGLGLIKLEGGLHGEAAQFFRVSLEYGNYVLQARLGLCCCFLASGENNRAYSMLEQISKEHQSELSHNPTLTRFWESLSLRAS